GQQQDFVDNVRTRLGDPTPVSFDLKARAQQQQAVQKAAETGTMTKEMERGMTKEQKEEYEKKAKENAAAMAKNKALNDAFNTGKEAMVAKNYPTAVESFQKATEIDPAQHVIWGQLAEAEIDVGNSQTGADQAASYQK